MTRPVPRRSRRPGMWFAHCSDRFICDSDIPRERSKPSMLYYANIPRAALFLTVGLLTSELAALEPGSRGLPKTFVPVDTARLQGSPNPLPLKAQRVFEKLEFKRPVELTFAPDGSDRIFVVEQQGTIRVFKNDPAAQQAEIFLDLRDVTLREGNEEGLLGLAFHPKFKTNGKFYVYYSTKPRSSVIAEFQVSNDPNKADRNSERRLLVIKQPYENHNGGSIQFGPDGFLYIGMGDGGLRDDPHENAQNLGSLLGKILRIDVDHQHGGLPYSVPKDNPFVDQKDVCGEIWSYGHRNIWRLGFDRKTGDLWVGEVGQDRFEEVNLIERGGNYGWNIREGLHDFQPSSPAKDNHLIDPLAEYFHGEGQSVTGGFVYRNPRLPDYDGLYFCADYLSGNVWTLKLDASRRVAERRQVARTELQIAAFGRDQHDEMYLCAFDGGIYRLQKREIDATAIRRDFPKTLTDTGLFTSVEKNEPAPGLIPYELNIPFWSDYAEKDRYLALPKAGEVEFKENEAWTFPVGTVLVKTFWMHQDRTTMKDARRLETRLLVLSNEGWNGYTYVYDDDEKEARLIDDSVVKSLEIKTLSGPLSQTYYFPSRTDCLTCHTKQHGFVLGLETAQLNRVEKYDGESENQLTLFNNLGIFKKPIRSAPDELDRFPDWGYGNFNRDGEDSSRGPNKEPHGDVATLARAWLDVNCSMCHLPDGIAPMKRDFRFETPLEKMNAIDQPIGQKRRRLDHARIVAPGDPLNSELLARVGLRGPYQMPPLATHYVDPHAYEILRRWISNLPPKSK
ncbi:MAG: hypothetical protein C0483_19750 [Pirellula sp.]|nr:hypothetical protein [Pirellula sp.]